MLFVESGRCECKHCKKERLKNKTKKRNVKNEKYS